jgi:hypothetical protein
MREIRGNARNLRALLGGAKFAARSLHERTYEHNPGSRRFIEDSGLEFRPHAAFNKADLDARQELYRALAERIWSPERLTGEVET